MPINDPTAVRFANEEIRPLADLYSQLYYRIRSARDYWVANDMGAKFPAGGGIVEDGAATDGRPVIDSDDVIMFATRMNELITDLDTNASVKLMSLMRIAVHPHG